MLKKLFGRKKASIKAPVAGSIIALNDVPDPIFAGGHMGGGFAVQPTSGEIYSPVAGRITSIFPTKHALLIKSDTAGDVLVHIGIDTVELNGMGFEISVLPDQKVDHQTKLATVDFKAIEEARKATDVIVVFPEQDPQSLIDQYDFSEEINVVL